MSGYMEPDEKQEWAHATHKIAELIATLHSSLIQAGLPETVADKIAVHQFAVLVRTDPLDMMKQIIEGQQ